MAQRPIFVATHPRACSTAFERVFMTRRDTLKCVHEPFGDAFYYGPESLGTRYENDSQTKDESGFGQTTFKSVFERFEREQAEGKRLFIKDMAYYIMPPDRKPARIAPSLDSKKRGIGTNGTVNGTTNGTTNGISNGASNGVVANGNSVSNGLYHLNGTSSEVENPTVVPLDLLEKFHYAFLIRDPHYSIPSYYRCTIPPLDELTGWDYFDESECGYEELRRFFDFVRKVHLVGPRHADGGHIDANNASHATNGVNGTNGVSHGGDDICVVDADDLLDSPARIIERFCNSTDQEYTPDMLSWDTEEEQAVAQAAFEKWPGFHDDALDSQGLHPRAHPKKRKTESQFDDEWREKYGEEGAGIIRSAVDKCMPDYLYLKKFTLKA